MPIILSHGYLYDQGCALMIFGRGYFEASLSCVKAKSDEWIIMAECMIQRAEKGNFNL